MYSIVSCLKKEVGTTSGERTAWPSGLPLLIIIGYRKKIMFCWKQPTVYFMQILLKTRSEGTYDAGIC